MNYVIGTADGDSLELLKREDGSVIVFGSKLTAEETLLLMSDGEDEAKVYAWY